jgi:hypothetical protein
MLLASSAFPSTVGVAALAAVSAATDRNTLTAGLGGVLAGMGLASLVGTVRVLLRERREGSTYYAERRGKRVFVRPG